MGITRTLVDGWKQMAGVQAYRSVLLKGERESTVDSRSLNEVVMGFSC